MEVKNKNYFNKDIFLQLGLYMMQCIYIYTFECFIFSNEKRTSHQLSTNFRGSG